MYYDVYHQKEICVFPDHIFHSIFTIKSDHFHIEQPIYLNNVHRMCFPRDMDLSL